MNKYTDTSAGIYTDNYPILSLSGTDFFENRKNDLADLLKDCAYFKCADLKERENTLSKLELILNLVEDVKILTKERYPDLEIRHISTGGSYLFKADGSNDIDFNIIVSGSHFSYTDIFEVDEINRKLPAGVRKISLMIFGEDDFLRKTGVDDSIEVEDYIHTSLCLREGLVFQIRNVPIYGHLCVPKNLDKKNILIRIKRQLFHAELMLEDKVDLHRNMEARLLKSIGRISEAYLYLSAVFPEFGISAKEAQRKEQDLSETLNRNDIHAWLVKARHFTDPSYALNQVQLLKAI